jgi:hypothetical protein
LQDQAVELACRPSFFPFHGPAIASRQQSHDDAVSMPIEEYGTPRFLAGAGSGPAIFEMARPSKSLRKFFTLPAFITHGLDTECAVPGKQGSRKHLCAIHLINPGTSLALRIIG